MNRQEDEDRVTGEYTVKDRVALGAMLLVPSGHGRRGGGGVCLPGAQ